MTRHNSARRIPLSQGLVPMSLDQGNIQIWFHCKCREQIGDTQLGLAPRPVCTNRNSSQIPVKTIWPIPKAFKRITVLEQCFVPFSAASPSPSSNCSTPPVGVGGAIVVQGICSFSPVSAFSTSQSSAAVFSSLQMQNCQLKKKNHNSHVGSSPLPSSGASLASAAPSTPPSTLGASTKSGHPWPCAP